MPELRKDPVINRWVIIATERAHRPSDYQKMARKTEAGERELCPFCPGHEAMTPPEVFSRREQGTKADQPGWWLRVVPNRFPALDRGGEAKREGEGIYDKIEGMGVHDVVIECPDHDLTLGSMPRFFVTETILAYKTRMLQFAEDTRLRYGLIFRNSGREAGASLSHPHSQIIGLPIVPKRPWEELEGSCRYYDQKERCIYCDVLHQEQKNGSERLVFENAQFYAFCPFASRFPFECQIFPKKHSARFEEIDSLGIELLAEAIQQVMARLEHVLQNPPYNFVLQTAPLRWKQDPTPFYHWNIQFLPRITSAAGFEWGTGFYINPMPPEEAARFLRKSTLFQPKEAKQGRG